MVIDLGSVSTGLLNVKDDLACVPIRTFWFKFLNTGSIQNKVEDTASGGINMVKKGASSVSSGLSNMMMPFIVLSGLGVLFMFLKK